MLAGVIARIGACPAQTRHTMQIYVKLWPNRAATLYSEAGEELWTFPSLEGAMALCLDRSIALGEALERGDIASLRVLLNERAVA
jgi:hypothetical protein